MDYLKKNGFSKSCPATKTKTTHKICEPFFLYSAGIRQLCSIIYTIIFSDAARLRPSQSQFPPG